MMEKKKKKNKSNSISCYSFNLPEIPQSWTILKRTEQIPKSENVGQIAISDERGIQEQIHPSSQRP